jgi:predicted amino acid-binding ACT domain protein
MARASGIVAAVRPFVAPGEVGVADVLQAAVVARVTLFAVVRQPRVMIIAGADRDVK